MRFGCCLNMVAEQADGVGFEHFDELVEAGYDYVELPLAEMTALDDDAFKFIQDKIAASELSCEVCNNFFPKHFRLTGNTPDSDDKIMGYVQKALQRASLLGAKKVVFGSGAAKQLPDGFSYEDGFKQLIELCRKIAPAAKEQGITVVIEPLRSQECNIINTYAEGFRLAESTKHPNIQALVDYYHLTEEQEPLEHLFQTGSCALTHVHFAHPEGRVYPRMENLDSYRAFFDALKQIGYDGTLSCEAYSHNFSADAKEALSMLKTAFN